MKTKTYLTVNKTNVHVRNQIEETCLIEILKVSEIYLINLIVYSILFYFYFFMLIWIWSTNNTWT
jgi:hypothetical protein